MAGQTWAFQVLAIWALKRARRFMGGTPWRGGFTGRTPWRGCFLEGRPVCSADPSFTSLALKPLAGALRGAPWRMGSDRGRAGSFPRCPCRGGRARWGASPEWHHPALTFDQSSGQVSPSCLRPVPCFPGLVPGDVHPGAAAFLSERSLCTRGNTVAFYSAFRPIPNTSIPPHRASPLLGGTGRGDSYPPRMVPACTKTDYRAVPDGVPNVRDSGLTRPEGAHTRGGWVSRTRVRRSASVPVRVRHCPTALALACPSLSADRVLPDRQDQH